jgi:hypothetical protein
MAAQPGDAQPGDAQPGDAQPGDAQPGVAPGPPSLPTEAENAPADTLDGQAEERAAPRTRTIVLLVAAIVAGILAVDVLSALIPGMDRLLAGWPVVLLVLVIGTLFVVVRALRA